MSHAPPNPPVFVLVRPQMGENIGAAARAMWNFGLDRMRLVAPRDGWPNSRAVALASGDGDLVELVEHLQACVEYKGEYRAVLEMRKMYAAYLKGYPGIKSLRIELMQHEEQAPILDRLARLREELCADRPREACA